MKGYGLYLRMRCQLSPTRASWSQYVSVVFSDILVVRVHSAAAHHQPGCATPLHLLAALCFGCVFGILLYDATEVVLEEAWKRAWKHACLAARQVTVQAASRLKINPRGLSVALNSRWGKRFRSNYYFAFLGAMVTPEVFISAPKARTGATTK
jgi:hypothetical protein